MFYKGFTAFRSHFQDPGRTRILRFPALVFFIKDTWFFLRAVGSAGIGSGFFIKDSLPESWFF